MNKIGCCQKIGCRVGGAATGCAGEIWAETLDRAASKTNKHANKRWSRLEKSIGGLVECRRLFMVRYLVGVGTARLAWRSVPHLLVSELPVGALDPQVEAGATREIWGKSSRFSAISASVNSADAAHFWTPASKSLIMEMATEISVGRAGNRGSWFE